MKLVLLLTFCILPFLTHGQVTDKTSKYASATMALGGGMGNVSIDFFHLWKLGKQKKFEVGLGGRLTSVFGSNQYFSSAPPDLARNNNYVDSVFLGSVQINALNIALGFGYSLSSKFSVGFNIDAIGVSFGSTQQGAYIKDLQRTNASATPTVFNVLLVDVNDRGTLNSEFYARYQVSEKWLLKIGLQHVFTEYSTNTQVQQVPQPNDRFRRIVNMFSLGVTKRF